MVASTVTKEKAPKAYSMAQLRASKKSLYVRNNTPLMWTLHEKVGDGKKIDLELRPHTQPNSITYLPPFALDAPGIARNIQQGKITVSPDLEQEMLDLIGAGQSTKDALLAKFQIGVEESPQARAIDSKDKMTELLAAVDRKRIVGQGQQATSSVINEFINPSPIQAEDGRVIDAMTGEAVTAPADSAVSPTEIKSVTLTPSVSSH